MTHEKHVELVNRYNEQVPEMNEFKKNLVIPENRMECPNCEGFGSEIGFACLTPVAIPCPACNGQGHTDTLYPYRKARGEALWKLRGIYEVTLRRMPDKLGMDIQRVSDIEQGYIPDIDYDYMENLYREKLESND